MKWGLLFIQLFAVTAGAQQIIPIPAHMEPGQGTIQYNENLLSVQQKNDIPAEGYTLRVDKDSIRIAASTPEGFFYAKRTLQQLIDSTLHLPVIKIEDAPAYPWRGFMMDVSRHFFTIDYLKHLIDQLSNYKMNTLHLHLTDDQGWRFEVKRYPKLTQGGAPYYTQEELRDLIAYAANRMVTIIPEIDMPGHMAAAIKAYPELACVDSTGWKKTFSIPLCPDNDTVYKFVEQVADEVMALFPTRYIHLGMDEVEESVYPKASQAAFAAHMQKYVAAHGKQLIAWDDVLNDSISKETMIMYWRDWVGGVPEATVKHGNKIIFTPGTPLYFNRDDSTLYPIYDLMPKAMHAIPDSFVMGAQANLWTERVETPAQADYKIFPRLLALAEVSWSPRGQLNWEAFKKRLAYHGYKGRSYALTPVVKVDTAIHLSFITEQVNPDIQMNVDSIIRDSAMVIASIAGHEPVFKRRYDFHKGIHKKVIYHSKWHKAYPAALEQTLTDGLRGGDNYNDGYYQGFTENMDVTIDLGKVMPVSSFAAHFLEATGAGVYLPSAFEVSISTDNKTFKKVPLQLKRAMKARYVKVVAKLNEKGGFIFTDEIVIY